MPFTELSTYSYVSEIIHRAGRPKEVFSEYVARSDPLTAATIVNLARLPITGLGHFSFTHQRSLNPEDFVPLIRGVDPDSLPFSTPFAWVLSSEHSSLF